MRAEFTQITQEPRQRDGLKVFYPRIARAMKREGMSTFGDLWKRIEALQAEPDVKALLGSTCYENVHVTISRNAKRSPFSRTSYGYNTAAQYVSMVFGCEEEDLFGPLPARSEVKAYNSNPVVALDEYLKPLNSAPVSDELSGAVQEVLASLSPRERGVLEMRCGFGGPKLTLQNIGEHFGVSKDRIRILEARALRKLRYPGRVEIIAGALGSTAESLFQHGF